MANSQNSSRVLGRRVLHGIYSALAEVALQQELEDEFAEFEEELENEFELMNMVHLSESSDVEFAVSSSSDELQGQFYHLHDFLELNQSPVTGASSADFFPCITHPPPPPPPPPVFSSPSPSSPVYFPYPCSSTDPYNPWVPVFFPPQVPVWPSVSLNLHLVTPNSTPLRSPTSSVWSPSPPPTPPPPPFAPDLSRGMFFPPPPPPPPPLPPSSPSSPSSNRTPTPPPSCMIVLILIVYYINIIYT